MSSTTLAPGEIAAQFVAALNSHDLDTVMRLASEDTVFESTGPAPDGERYAGQAAVRRVFTEVLSDPAATFTIEGRPIADDDVVVVRWRYDYTSGHTRGVTLFTIEHGRITRNQAYVKG